MTRNIPALTGLRRPSILLTAARLGAKNYHRKKVLSRLLKQHEKLGQESVVTALRGVENLCEQNRLAGEGSYSAQSHVQVLAALISEARKLDQAA